MVKLLSRIVALVTASLLAVPLLHADGARFDLTGPPIGVRVTRAGMSLPIDAVPNLQAGDKIWLHPELPESQSVRYLLVVAFLRGNTNPPPDSWFVRIPTWDKKIRSEGTSVTVPAEAQQVILFLAPVTGGDFTTLRSAVQGRPGVFVRASQDLVEAGFEQARIEKYVSAMKQVPSGDSKALLQHSTLLAGTLNLKPNEDCFKRPVEQQESCLTQSGNQMLLDDGHSQSIASQMANGPNADLIAATSYTSLGGAGLYSAYVGAVVDLVRVLSGLHTAKYQYIPAIAFPDGENLNLRLNTPPSFHDPKSVIVIGMPAVLATTPPPLHAIDDKQVACLLKPNLTLQVGGAPLVFSTGFAHDLTLHLNTPQPTPDLPLSADAYQGGLVIVPATKRRELPVPPEHAADDAAKTKTSPAAAATPASAPTVIASTGPLTGTGQLTGTIRGYWGFDKFTGPTLLLQNVPGKDWRVVSDAPLIAGRAEHIEIASSGTACIQTITAEAAPGKSIKADWKRTEDSGKVDVSLALQTLSPADMHLAIQQFGDPQPQMVAAKTFSEPAKLDTLLFHVGDTTAELRGAHLDQVKQVDLAGAVFMPQPVTSDTISTDADIQLAMPTATPAKFSLHPGEKLMAKVALKDGRTLPLAATIAAPRPSITLLNRSAQTAAPSLAAAPIQLTSKDDLPITQALAFSLRSVAPFPRQEQIEIASPDNSLHTTLSVASGSLVLQDPHTILGSLDAMKVFGASAFGPLRLRALAPDGSAGDWLPLVTLVRLPQLSELHCPDDATQPCTLSGSSLYLIDAISAVPEFMSPATVPEGFLGDSLPVPHPTGAGTLYLHLRDDPAVVNTVTLPVQPQ